MLTRAELLLIAGIVFVCLAVIIFVGSNFARREPGHKSNSKHAKS